MTEPKNPPLPSPPAPKRQRQPSAAARWVRKARETQVLDALRSGVSLEAIARQEGVSRRRMRDVVNALLAKQEGVEPPDGLAQLRSHRLDQAVNTAVLQMPRGSAAAIGQIVRALREMDRNAEIGRPLRTKISLKTEA